MNKTFHLLLILGLLLALTFLPLLTVSAQEVTPQIIITQVDNSKFPQVTVYISVTNVSGEPVNVSPLSLEVFENGELMIPTAITGQGEIGPLTSLLVMDISGSMLNFKKIDGAKDAAKAYVEQMRPQDQAGLISFNTEVKVVQSVTSDRAALITAIDSLQPDLDTAMFNALGKGIEILEPISGRKTIVLLSDGLDNVSRLTLDDIINTIGPAGLSISTIGLGDPGKIGTNNGLDEPALLGLASRAGGVYRFANGPNALVSLYEQLGRALQSEFSITYLSPLNLRDGVNRELTVSITGNSVKSQYNPGGVLPEVSKSSLPLFGGLLAGLLILLVVPFLFKGGRKTKTKLTSPSTSAKGRVRLK
jgi:Ca-activated chloride channel homolog